MGEQTKSQYKVQIRWLIRRDMPEVLEIERACFDQVWTEEDFLCCLRQRNCIGMVAEYRGRIVGFMIYELHRARLRILNFAVHPEMQRRGIGHQMAERLIDKLSRQRRREIVLEVRESNLSAQLFFASQGFRAVAVQREFYEDTIEDAYTMCYWLEAEEEPVLLPFTPKNRISEYDSDWEDREAA